MAAIINIWLSTVTDVFMSAIKNNFCVWWVSFAQSKFLCEWNALNYSLAWFWIYIHILVNDICKETKSKSFRLWRNVTNRLKNHLYIYTGNKSWILHSNPFMQFHTLSKLSISTLINWFTLSTDSWLQCVLVIMC